MAHNEPSAVWHPALRSEDGAPSNAPVPDDLAQDSEDSVAESAPELKDSQKANQDTEPQITSTSSGTDAPIEAQHTAAPDVTESDVLSHADQDSKLEISRVITEEDIAREEASDINHGLGPAVPDELQAMKASQESAPTVGPAYGNNVNGPQETAAPNTAAEDLSSAEYHNTEAHEDNGTPSWFHEYDRPDRPTTNGSVNDDNHGLWGSPTDGNTGDDFFNQLKTQTKPIYVPPETDSRYDEGVPLLDDTVLSPTQPSVNEETQINNIFEGDGDEDGEAFFSEVQKSTPREETESSFHTTRKSTTQVIGSPEVSPDSASPTAQEFSSGLTAAASESQTKKDVSEDDLAARWQAELLDDQPEKGSEDDLAAMWQAALDDDDDLLLEDETAEVSNEPHSLNLNGTGHTTASAALSSPFGTPQSFARSQPQHTTYTPHQPSTSDLLQGIPGIAPQASTAPVQDYFASSSQPRPTAKRAESFAERSKEGYKSPYDLPDDLTRPRKPVVTHKPVVAQPGSMPPPRSNSMPPPPNASAVPIPPPAASTVTAVPAPKNFYEELPLLPSRPKSRPASSGRYTPSANIVTSPPTSHSQPPLPANPYANLSTGEASPQPQLQQPEQLDPCVSQFGPSAAGAPTAPSATSRYSPKPPTVNTGIKPPSAPRYSPVPPQPTAPQPPRTRYASQPPSISGQGTTLPFQPRTSSPLAHHEKVSYQPQQGLATRPPVEPASYAPNGVQLRTNEQEVSGSTMAPIGARDPTAANAAFENISATLQPTSPPRNPYAPPAYINEFSKRVAPMASPPSASAPPTGDSRFAPPRRSQTQSPSQQTSGPRLSIPSLDHLQRPASVHAPGSPTKSADPYVPSQTSIHSRVPSHPLEFIPPTDGQELDPFERWKGAPIVKFGFGGSITSCFPKHVPRYTVGQAAPKIKSTPGEVKICSLNDWILATEGIVQHPGPLKNKSKKKELLAWLSSKVAAFENEGISEAARLHPDSSKRHDEKILLWKVVRALVEHDGVLEGSAEVEKSLRCIIFPRLQNPESDLTSGSTIPVLSALQPLSTPSQSDATGCQSMENIRNSLLVGNREKAVWDAVDSRLWGHAMIIASTLDKSVWKQVVQEFVRREVRSTASNSESLAALYEIFAGNIDESVDELVPPSARAGFQMISKDGGHGPSKNALDGLDSWRDTLGLVLSNRSPEDNQALLALGRLLLSYGRTEAAHVCFIFSRAAVFGGADDPQTSIVLLGADHQHLPPNVLQDEDAILLTEAYEYAVSILANSPTSALPHLLAFKLLHACSLAEYGRKSEALQYADAITAALKATTKPSGYHNQHLFYGVDELSTRLRQTNSDNGSSWISKPSMEKVSGSMWAKFNSFVAGEDSDAASTGSGKAADGDVGPFAKFSGTPTMSRSPSVSDFGPYSSMPATQPVSSSGPSRYQPSNQYVPNSSPEQYRGRSSLDSQRSSSFGYSFGQRRGSQEPSTPIEGNAYQGPPLYGSPAAVGYQSTPPQTSYIPLAPVVEDSVPPSYPVDSAPMQGSPVHVSPYQPPGNDSFGEPLDSSAVTMAGSSAAGYIPPDANGGYEPPSVEISTAPTLHTTEEPTSQDVLKKKKSFMDDDDDDDIAARAAAIQKAEKARKDREADEAFRKAAEADAKKPPAAGRKSWFGGWFGGAKKENDLSGGPIRAKLGEENSFYYDSELKKWVNKKDPSSANIPRGTPPPPKAPAPPSRSASGSSAPPVAGMGLVLDSRPSSSAGVPPPLSNSPAPSSLAAPPPLLGTTPRSVSTGAAMPTPPLSSSGPPPRPATSLSHASSIDDLLGAPQARKGAPARGRKKGRYVDVMAK